MTKLFSYAAAAVIFLAAPAFAQDVQTTTHEKTTVNGADGSQSVNASKTVQNTDAMGNTAESTKSFNKQTDIDGSAQVSHTSKSNSTYSDGTSVKTEKSESTVTP